MKKLAISTILAIFAILAPEIAKSQFYCAETKFYNSCVNCDGILFTGAAWETTFWQCVPCTESCPSDIAPQSKSVDGSPASTSPSCGLSWNEFAQRARAAEQVGGLPDIRYVRVDFDDNLLRSLARSAPLIANYLVTQDGYIRLDRQDPNLTSVNQDPAMISSFEVTGQMVNWLIDNRDKILTEEGRATLTPPRAEPLERGLAQAVYTNFERIDAATALATVRATRFRLPNEKSGNPTVLSQNVLELELRTGKTAPIPDDIRPVLGDSLPGRQTSAEISEYSLHSSR